MPKIFLRVKKYQKLLSRVKLEFWGTRRFFVRGHFVLVFQYDKTTDTINFDDFDHQDIIYKKR